MQPESQHITPRPTRVILAFRDLTDAVLSLPAPGPLPLRTVLVPNERVAYALRREILRAGRPDALAGTLFCTPVVAAQETLAGRGTLASPGEEELRPLRLRALFRNDPGFEYFEAELLRETLGWDRAFAQTIGDLEAAGHRPETIDGTLDPRLRDLANAWRRVEAEAGSSRTSSQVLHEAAVLLERDPTAWPYEGSVLVVLDPDRSAAELRFLASIPGAELAVGLARPTRRRTLARLEALFGEAAANEIVRRRRSPEPARSELAILAAHLFEPSEVLAAADRVRSSGPDGTVRLEQYAGIDEEIEAAVEWVVEQILERGVPLSEIAILTPARDPYVELIRARLARLPGGGETGVPSFAPDGVPAASTAEGARLLQLVRALRRHLDAASLAALLPLLRTEDAQGEADRYRLSPATADALAYGLGTLGGSPADPRGALTWSERLAARESEIARALEDPLQERDHWRLEELAHDMRRVRRSVEALVEVARHVVDASPLPELWSAIADVVRDGRLVLPPPPAGIVGRLDEVFGSSAAGSALSSLSGDEALRVIEEAIEAQRLVHGRFGDPAVYVGTIAGAVGLPFRAVRIVGLAEGAVPSVPHEDPVLPDALRRTLGSDIHTTQDAAERELHQLDRIVRDTSETIAFSAPRLDAQRSQREVSSLYVELAAALGRPDEAAQDKAEKAATIPSIPQLERLYVARSRAERAALRPRLALLDSTRAALVASGALLAPAGLAGEGAHDVARIEALLDPNAAPGALDGCLPEAAALLASRFGLDAERPTSASKLERMLRCPHRELLERGLGFAEPFGPPSSGRIDAVSYGSLLHGIWESFARRHGPAFGARERSLEEWQTLGDAIVDEQLDVLLAEYALFGAHVRTQERARARDDFRALLRLDWRNGAPSRHVAAEHAFGREAPLALDVAGGPIYLRGFIDRIDVRDGRTWVRDLKTGHARPRLGSERDADHVRDVQIATYGLVVESLAARLEVPPQVAVAYFHLDLDHPERAFADDWPALASTAREWLGVVATLVRDGHFPRTPREEDCKYCPHRPVCGPRAAERARDVSRRLGAATEALALLKGVDLPTTEEDFA